MTGQERLDRINALGSELLELRHLMAESDPHAAKCAKLGLSFRDEYPDEYGDYERARERYNEAEAELAEAELAEPDDMATPPDGGERMGG